jgi:hypothetical protein
MAGSGHFYGSNGGSNAAGAMVEGMKTTMQMTQIAMAPFMLTPVAPLAIAANAGMNFTQGNYVAGVVDVVAIVAPALLPIALLTQSGTDFYNGDPVGGTINLVLGAVGLVGMVRNCRWGGASGVGAEVEVNALKVTGGMGQASDAAIHRALVDSFNRADLKQLVRFNSGQSLEVIVNDTQPLNGVVSDLIEWARKEGRLGDLVNAAKKARP